MKALCPGEEAQLQQYFAFWSNYIEQNEPERSEIEKAVAEIYRHNKLETPPIVFADSPWQMFSIIILLRILVLSEDALALKAEIEQQECSEMFRRLLTQIDTQVGETFLKELNAKMRFGGNPARNLYAYNTYIAESRICLGHGITFGEPDLWVDKDFRRLAMGIRIQEQLRRGNLADEQVFAGVLLSRDAGRAFRLFRDEAMKALPEATQDRLRKVASRQTAEEPNDVEDKLSAFLRDEWQLLRHQVSWTLAQRTIIATMFALSRVRPSLASGKMKEYFAHWSVLARNSAAVIGFEKLFVVTRPPVAIHTDEHNRVHHESDSAIACPDGYGVYSWHNLRVEPWVIQEPVTLELIRSEANVEIRRVLIERYGFSRFLLDSGAELIHQDQYGWLYRVALPDDEPLVMVKLLNSTPEPDGSFREYFLRVPPTVVTAREAVAWTFNLSADEYAPTAES